MQVSLPVRLFADERGFALVFALLALVVLSIAATTAIVITSESSRSASHSTADQVALNLAESGLAFANAKLHGSSAGVPNNALDPALLPPTTATYEGGTVTWSGTLDQTTQVWTLTATGTVANPPGPSSALVRRTVTATVNVTASFAQPLNAQA